MVGSHSVAAGQFVDSLQRSWRNVLQPERQAHESLSDVQLVEGTNTAQYRVVTVKEPSHFALLHGIKTGVQENVYLVVVKLMSDTAEHLQQLRSWLQTIAAETAALHAKALQSQTAVLDQKPYLQGKPTVLVSAALPGVDELPEPMTQEQKEHKLKQLSDTVAALAKELAPALMLQTEVYLLDYGYVSTTGQTALRRQLVKLGSTICQQGLLASNTALRAEKALTTARGRRHSLPLLTSVEDCMAACIAADESLLPLKFKPFVIHTVLQ